MQVGVEAAMTDEPVRSSAILSLINCVSEDLQWGLQFPAVPTCVKLLKLGGHARLKYIY